MLTDQDKIVPVPPLAPSHTSTQAFVCILKDYSKLEALLLACVEHDLPGGTILDGRGMGQVLCQDIPLFLHLRDHFPEAEGDSYILLSVVSSTELDLCFTLAEQICGPSSQGVIFALPVTRFKRFSPSKAYFSKPPQPVAPSDFSEELTTEQVSSEE